MKTPLKIQDLFIYPIKSLPGIRVFQGIVEERGFKNDRRRMLVDAEGMFITQRKFPQLSQIDIQLRDDVIFVQSKNQRNDTIEIPLDLAEGPDKWVTVWDDQIMAKIVSAEVSEWFSDFLGFPVDLVLMPESSKRRVDPTYAVNEETVSFADGMPYLIIGQASLDELNSKLESPIEMARFRPNIVFAGGEPFLEDSLKKIKIGEVEFQIVKPCARCVLTTIDPVTGEKGPEPLRTLATYRTRNNKVYFGQNVVALQSGKIQTGDLLAY